MLLRLLLIMTFFVLMSTIKACLGVACTLSLQCHKVKVSQEEQKEGVKVVLFQKLSRFPLGSVEGNQEGFTNGD